jgi:hypothetical protein
MFNVLSDYHYWAQTLYGLSGDNAAPEADPDGDGASNQAEFIAGTNPTNAISVLRIEAVSAMSNQVVPQWTPVLGRLYHVQCTPAIGSTNLCSDLCSNLASGMFIHRNATLPKQFYRLRVTVP